MCTSICNIPDCVFSLIASSSGGRRSRPPLSDGVQDQASLLLYYVYSGHYTICRAVYSVQNNVQYIKYCISAVFWGVSVY